RVTDPTHHASSVSAYAASRRRYAGSLRTAFTSSSIDVSECGVHSEGSVVGRGSRGPPSFLLAQLRDAGDEGLVAAAAFGVVEGGVGPLEEIDGRLAAVPAGDTG